MRRDAYHHILVAEPPLGGATSRWLGERLSNARAAFLQRLGVTSSRLRAQGLQLRLAAESDTPPLAPDLVVPVGVTLQLVAVDIGLYFTETLYLVDDTWQPFWRGRVRIWAEADDARVPLPREVQREAFAWLRLVRGSVPVCSEAETRRAEQY